MGKIITLEEAIDIARKARDDGKIVVATNGCFDLLHVGHVRNLSDSKTLGDLLIVGINSDASVREIKGPLRPLMSEEERAEVVAALAAVDYVFIFSERTPVSWIEKVRPHIHTKGGGDDVRNHPDFPEQMRIIAAAGGTMQLVPHSDERSTSRLISIIVDRFKK